MRKLLATVPLAALAFTYACADGPNLAGVTDDDGLVRSVVFTEGIPAPTVGFAGSPLFSDLNFHDALLNGSSTTTVQLHPGQTVVVKIVYRVTGRQGGDEWIRVNTTQSWNGTAWIGSDPADFKVDGPRVTGSNPTPPQDIEVDVSITHDGTETSGSETLTITPAIVTGEYQTPANPRLEIESSAVLTIEFIPSGATNQNPFITVIVNPLELEAGQTPPVNQVVVTWDPFVTESIEEAIFDNIIVVDPDGDPVTTTCSIGGTDIDATTALALGDYNVTCTAEDDQGGVSDPAGFELSVRDTTAPTFTNTGLWGEDVERIATDIGGWAFDHTDFGITASDLPLSSPVSNPAVINCLPADGTVLPIGSSTTVSCTATDQAGNVSAPSTFDLFITLDFSSTCGFGAPLRNSPEPYSAHKRNSTIPHKVCAPSYADGSLATDLADGLSLKLDWAGTGTADGEAALEDPAAGSTMWRWVENDEHYIFNAKTARDWATGLWKTTVEYAEIVLAETYFYLNR